jgi:hypothetical protein
MEIVNGYVCRDCADVALAKRNIDPAHPNEDPLRGGDPARRDDMSRNAMPGAHLGALVDLRA